MSKRSSFLGVNLHNYSYEASDVLFADRFKSLLESFPLFTGDDVDKLIGFLRPRVTNGDDGEIVKTIEQSPYKASRKLLEHVDAVVKGNSQYVLLDEQMVVYDRVFEAATEGITGKKKSVIIVKGGPGTGKSVIAMNLLGDLSAKGLNTHYVTGSRAFTTTVREIVGSRASQQIKYFNGYASAERYIIDVMVCDEAHRIRETSNSRFTPRTKRSKDPQVSELIRASKTTVFFIDDDQVVRPSEIGSSDYIRAYAKQIGCAICDYELEAQFRRDFLDLGGRRPLSLLPTVIPAQIFRLRLISRIIRQSAELRCRCRWTIGVGRGNSGPRGRIMPSAQLSLLSRAIRLYLRYGNASFSESW